MGRPALPTVFSGPVLAPYCAAGMNHSLCDRHGKPRYAGEYSKGKEGGQGGEKGDDSSADFGLEAWHLSDYPTPLCGKLSAADHTLFAELRSKNRYQNDDTYSVQEEVSQVRQRESLQGPSRTCAARPVGPSLL